jgi:hypothetical protein
MKNKLAILGGVLSFALAIPMNGRVVADNIANADFRQNITSVTEVPPTFEATTAGVHLKVWVLAKQGEIKDNDMSSAKATKTEPSVGSYQIMVELKNAENGKDMPEATASIMTISPTNKNATVELKPIKNQLGCNLTLDEKGEYQFTFNINSAGVTKTTTFKYTVQ